MKTTTKKNQNPFKTGGKVHILTQIHYVQVVNLIPMNDAMHCNEVYSPKH